MLVCRFRKTWGVQMLGFRISYRVGKYGNVANIGIFYISISVLCSIPQHPSPRRTLYRNFINRKRCYFSTFSDEKNTVSIKDKIMAASGGVLVILIIVIIGLLVKYRREKKSDQEAPLLDQQVCFSFSLNDIYVSWIQFATYFCHFHSPIAIKRSSLFVTRLFQRIQ